MLQVFLHAVKFHPCQEHDITMDQGIFVLAVILFGFTDTFAPDFNQSY